MNRCRVCGGDRITPYGKFRYFSLQKCSTCGFVAKTFGPELKELVSKGSVYESGEWIESRQTDEAVRSYARMLFDLYKPHLKPGSLLEIGPGDGWNLRLARDAGWSVAGVESSRANCEYIKAEHGIEVINDRFENVRLGSRFDNILLSHVIEHIDEPALFLKRTGDLLVQAGAMIIATPNLCSRWSRLFGPGWSPYLVPDHVSFFCPKHLEMIAGDGYTTVLNETYEGPANLPDSLLSTVFSSRFQDRMMQKLKEHQTSVGSPTNQGRMLKYAMSLPGRPFRGLGRAHKGTDLILILKKR